MRFWVRNDINKLSEPQQKVHSSNGNSDFAEKIKLINLNVSHYVEVFINITEWKRSNLGMIVWIKRLLMLNL